MASVKTYFLIQKRLKSESPMEMLFDFPLIWYMVELIGPSFAEQFGIDWGGISYI